MSASRPFWIRLLPASLTNRVFLLYSVLLVVIVGLGLALFLRQQFQKDVRDSQLAAVMLAEVVAQAVQDSVVIGDYDTVEKTLKKAVLSPMVATADFIDLGGGKVHAENYSADTTRPPATLVAWVQRQLDGVNRNITVGGKDYGVLRLQFDGPHIASGLWSATLAALQLAFISLLIGLVLIRFALARWLGSLDELRTVLEVLGQGGQQTNIQISPNAPSEIRRVVDMFNQTAVLVREREASRRALDEQKFALDQHAIVSMTDRAGTITYANDRFCEISGYSREELLGSNHRLVKSGQHSADFYVDMWQTLSNGHVWHGEVCNRKRNGELYWVSATLVPLMDEHGLVDHYIGIRTDITERKNMELSLDAAKQAAEQANVAKSQFLANMSHEIRTPMNAILGMLTLLQRTELSTQQADYASKTEGAAKSLLGLLNDILDFSKVEAGKMTLDPRPFRVDQLMRDLKVILSANVGNKPVVLRQELAPDVPLGLLGDDMRLRQVLINLGGNALKFTEAGDVVLQVRLCERTENDVLLEFVVRDTGIGIAPENQAHIFSGFSQAEASTTRRFGGTGLGLAISQRLVALMGGQLTLHSELHKGSIFSFQLRMPVADVELPKPQQETVAGASKPKRLQGVRLLVVEDNKINQMVAKGLLTQEGASVTLADNGQLGVQAVANAQPVFDAVLMDLQMPVMDGYAATQHIRTELGLHTLPIVAMTANAMASDRDACLAAGMNDHVGKPFEIDQLVDVILRFTRT